eukprot:gb/GECG01006921.1/.p1 GENE.gb/GECG01006921.1/~~gb/GECG01006921.1/.p1  ORF type:complete len:239 (+),score=29.40 gb/GECG01006921.1/:1-717(+)
MSQQHRESQPRAIAMPRGKHGKFDSRQIYQTTDDMDSNIGHREAIVNHRKLHLREYGRQGGQGGGPVAQSLPPAAPVIGSLPPPKMNTDMPELSLPEQSPQASSIFEESHQQQRRGPVAASAPARSAMHEQPRQRVSSLHENDATDEQLSSSPVLSVMQSMKSYGRTPGTQASTTADRSFHTDSLSSSRNRDSQFATGLQGLSIQEEEPRKKMGFNLSEGKGSESESESDDGLMFEAD